MNIFDELQHHFLLRAVSDSIGRRLSVCARELEALDLLPLRMRLFYLFLPNRGGWRARRDLPWNLSMGVALQPSLSKRFLDLLGRSCSESHLSGDFQVLEFLH